MLLAGIGGGRRVRRSYFEGGAAVRGGVIELPAAERHPLGAHTPTLAVPLTSFGHSTHYTHLDQALRSRWPAWLELEREMRTFVPKPYEEYRPQIEAEITRLKVLNPGHTAEQLQAYVDRQFSVSASDWWQFHEKFDSRHMTEYVTVALLAHALAEAIANAMLAIGLANVGAEALFAVLERADFREKWLVGPKAFAPAYEFPSGTALHETLVMLARQRNALVHSKIELTVGNERILAGSGVERQGYEEEGRWIRRFFNLPYDLAGFAQKALRPVPLMLLFDRTPIEGWAQHGA